jgi:hypothetical protein
LYLHISINAEGEGSTMDLVLFKPDPFESARCGLARVLLECAMVLNVLQSIRLNDLYPMKDIELALWVPWFLRR